MTLPSQTGYCWNESCLLYGISKRIKLSHDRRWMCPECGEETYTKAPPIIDNIYSNIEVYDIEE